MNKHFGGRETMIKHDIVWIRDPINDLFDGKLNKKKKCTCHKATFTCKGFTCSDFTIGNVKAV
jgi:hypothetical protein